jgi:hypothetical protein
MMAQTPFRGKFFRVGVVVAGLLLSGSAGVLALTDSKPHPPLFQIDTFDAPNPTQAADSKQMKAETDDEPTPEPEASSPGADEDCTNSFEPDCGPFHWIKQPGPNQPLHISIDHAPMNPTVGEVVTVTVKLSDADAPVFGSSLNGTWGDDGLGLIPPLTCGPAPHGGWTPPDPTAGSESFTFTHVYSEAGTFDVGFAGSSSSGDPWGPFSCFGEGGLDHYGSEATASIEIVVSPEAHDAPSPTPTTAPSPTSSPTPA